MFINNEQLRININNCSGNIEKLSKMDILTKKSGCAALPGKDTAPGKNKKAQHIFQCWVFNAF